MDEVIKTYVKELNIVLSESLLLYSYNLANILM